MTVRRTPVTLFVGLWTALLLFGLLGSAVAPSVALADGSGCDTLPMKNEDVTTRGSGSGGDSESNPDELSFVELFITLMYVLL